MTRMEALVTTFIKSQFDYNKDGRLVSRKPEPAFAADVHSVACTVSHVPE